MKYIIHCLNNLHFLDIFHRFVARTNVDKGCRKQVINDKEY